MFKTIEHNKEFWLQTLLFIVFGCASLLLQEPLLIVVPFIVVLAPLIFQFCITQPQQLYWLLLFFLPLSTEVNFTPSLGLDFPDEGFMMLLSGILIVQLLFKPNSFPTSVLRLPLFLIVVLQFLWLVVVCFYSCNSLLSVKFMLARIWYILPFVVLPQLFLNTPTQLKKAALLLLLPMGFVVVQCLLRHALLGFSFEGIKETLSPFFRNHVNYSAMLVCLLAVLWCVKSLTPTSNKYYQWLNIGLAVGLVALFFAYSRGAWIALFTGITTVFIIQKKWMVQTISIVVIASLFLIGWLVSNKNYVQFSPNYEQTIFHDDLGEHLKSTTTLKDLSNAERFYRWVAGAKMFTEEPIVGFGPNTFYTYYKGYTVDVFKTYVSNNPEHSSVHNYFLLMALEQGIIGLLLFCCLLFVLLWYTEKLYHQLHNNFYRKIALTTGVVVVMIATINCMSDMIETDKIGSLFWLSVGMVIVLSNKLKEEKESIA